MQQSPSVSVVVPCCNEASHIESCLSSILAQQPPDGGFEVIVADGMSNDGTRDILCRIARSHSNLRIIDNPERIVPTGLNAAIRAARGEIIIRMDAHTEYAPDYIRQCVATLAATGADNVGGPARTRWHSPMQRAVCIAYHYPFACGGARFHDPNYEGYVDTVTYGCWRKETLFRIGLFDEELVRNQDDELNLRLIRSGGKIWQSPSIQSWYYPRASLSAHTEVIPLREMRQRIAGGASDTKPVVSVTFDDAFANFFTQALPILERYRVPATVSTVTSLIGRPEPMPFDHWSFRNAAAVSSEVWRPMNWAELEACADSDLVTIGAHSHSHWNGLECTTEQMREEAKRSFAILSERLGPRFGKVYSYPYGSVRLGQVPPAYVEAVRDAGFELAVTTELGLASSESDLLLLPRVEAHGLDTPEVILAKAKGVLFPYFLADRLRQGKRPFGGSPKDIALLPAPG